MNKRMLMLVVLAALVALAGCERKVKKPDENGASEKQADQQADEAAQAEQEPAAEKAEPTPEPDDIPVLADEDVDPALLDPSKLDEKAPETFKAKFITSAGDFVVEFHRDWAPNGADRAYNLIKANYYDDIAFFRVVPGFMAQFGIHANPKVNAAWKDATIPDDPVKKSNTRGMVTFAQKKDPHTRLTHLFINYKDNSALDAQGFAPVGEVVEGMETVDELYAGYGDGPPFGKGPNQELLTEQGNAYLNQNFPKLDYIEDVVIVDE